MGLEIKLQLKLGIKGSLCRGPTARFLKNRELR